MPLNRSGSVNLIASLIEQNGSLLNEAKVMKI